MTDQWNHKVFGTDHDHFDNVALELFYFQAEHNPVYREFIRAIGINPSRVQKPEQVPFLPIRFFKSHAIKTTDFEPELVFESSGTTGSVNSRHLVKDSAIYETSFLNGFRASYGPADEWCIIGLLPSYLERNNSSLVYMVDRLVRESNHPQSGFYLHEFNELAAVLKSLEARGQKTLLIGVSFALLDFAEQFPQPLEHTVIMETGGMKGRREEMIRPALHAVLQSAFRLPVIHSEYGMTELLSQAYSPGNGLFSCPPWMKILLRDEEDPFLVKTHGSGTINVIDLANIYSCAFIATDDIGKLQTNGQFEVQGRVDGSDLRGCSLMVV